ncbi:hypothetical protein CLCR_10998 [Cladophialophora carrionii]|uniref:Uncharacterized protein n=1 Tax=Cladophialophora carrionii TaxID=86049 RepID=A0A1C1CW17_9EURO|nr:hypothetical protein CLCR_10998 [Cladophialophora carrionii]
MPHEGSRALELCSRRVLSKPRAKASSVTRTNNHVERWSPGVRDQIFTNRPLTAHQNPTSSSTLSQIFSHVAQLQAPRPQITGQKAANDIRVSLSKTERSSLLRLQVERQKSAKLCAQDQDKTLIPHCPASRRLH